MSGYHDDLLFALRLRDVPGPRIAEALAEVDSHVAESGEDPLEAFGPPKAYPTSLPPRWAGRRRPCGGRSSRGGPWSASR